MKFELLPHFCSISSRGCVASLSPQLLMSHRRAALFPYIVDPRPPPPPIARHALTMKAYSSKPDFLPSNIEVGFSCSKSMKER
jgi:hypothetical protein